MRRILANVGCWSIPALLAVLDGLGWDVPAVAYVVAIFAGFIGFLIGGGAEGLNRMNRGAVEPVVLAFRHGYDLRAEHCNTTCTDAQIIPFPKAAGQDWSGIDADATTVRLPRLPVGRRRPAPRVRHR